MIKQQHWQLWRNRRKSSILVSGCIFGCLFDLNQLCVVICVVILFLLAQVSFKPILMED